MYYLYSKLPYFSIFAVCFILHVIADFSLQGLLANLKQKEWWENNHPASLYRNDYIAAGVIHAFFWSLLTFLPLAMTNFYGWAVVINTPIHYLVDNLKANKKCLSLTFDQMLHFGQIMLTLDFFFSLYIK